MKRISHPSLLPTTHRGIWRNSQIKEWLFSSSPRVHSRCFPVVNQGRNSSAHVVQTIRWASTGTRLDSGTVNKDFALPSSSVATTTNTSTTAAIASTASSSSCPELELAATTSQRLYEEAPHRRQVSSALQQEHTTSTATSTASPTPTAGRNPHPILTAADSLLEVTHPEDPLAHWIASAPHDPKVIAIHRAFVCMIHECVVALNWGTSATSGTSTAPGTTTTAPHTVDLLDRMIRLGIRSRELGMSFYVPLYESMVQVIARHALPRNDLEQVLLEIQRKHQHKVESDDESSEETNVAVSGVNATSSASSPNPEIDVPIGWILRIGQWVQEDAAATASALSKARLSTSTTTNNSSSNYNQSHGGALQELPERTVSEILLDFFGSAMIELAEQRSLVALEHLLQAILGQSPNTTHVGSMDVQVLGDRTTKRLVRTLFKHMGDRWESILDSAIFQLLEPSVWSVLGYPSTGPPDKRITFQQALFILVVSPNVLEQVTGGGMGDKGGSMQYSSNYSDAEMEELVESILASSPEVLGSMFPNHSKNKGEGDTDLDRASGPLSNADVSFHYDFENDVALVTAVFGEDDDEDNPLLRLDEDLIQCLQDEGDWNVRGEDGSPQLPDIVEQLEHHLQLSRQGYDSSSALTPVTLRYSDAFEESILRQLEDGIHDDDDDYD
eukprot:Nitzschia sp. Nitz4//scaffold208_size52459//36320//38335//NITZ4_006816-RA/size52459-processed-gene-0.27-mRNA-1//1//CDS//3329541669//979//frame0